MGKVSLARCTRYDIIQISSLFVFLRMVSTIEICEAFLSISLYLYVYHSSLLLSLMIFPLSHVPSTTIDHASSPCHLLPTESHHHRVVERRGRLFEEGYASCKSSTLIDIYHEQRFVLFRPFHNRKYCTNELKR